MESPGSKAWQLAPEGLKEWDHPARRELELELEVQERMLASAPSVSAMAPSLGELRVRPGEASPAAPGAVGRQRQ